MNYKFGFWCIVVSLCLSCATTFMLKKTIRTQQWQVDILQQTVDVQNRIIGKLNMLLDDPHHCVSVCQEEFAKMGC